jgi:hypothetical protein
LHGTFEQGGGVHLSLYDMVQTSPRVAGSTVTSANQRASIALPHFRDTRYNCQFEDAGIDRFSSAWPRKNHAFDVEATPAATLLLYGGLMESEIEGRPMLDVRVTRFALRRMQLGQMLVPVGFLAGLLARRFPEMVNPYLVFALYAGILFVILGAIKRLGKRPLQTRATAIELGNGLRVQASDVTCWAIYGELARLYGTEASFGLRARSDDAHELETQLTSVFGTPQILQPRGSLRARWWALGVSFVGLLAASSVVIHGNKLALFLGVACTFLGFGAFATLRQRILRLS